MVLIFVNCFSLELINESEHLFVTPFKFPKNLFTVLESAMWQVFKSLMLLVLFLDFIYLFIFALVIKYISLMPYFSIRVAK